MFKPKDKSSLSLGQSVRVCGVEIKKMPLGAYLRALDKLRNLPEDFISQCFPGKTMQEVLDSLSGIDENGVIGLITTVMDGLNTVLPYGVRKVDALRTLTTESVAVFIPFRVQEVSDRGGVYYGINAISRNMIICDKRNLLNANAFRLGVPGSGKSFGAKEEMTFIAITTDDDILVCDPEGEYVRSRHVVFRV